MSVRATNWVWEQALPPSEKLVLLRLADHANPDGGDVYPSVASVAASTGISERQVQRYIKRFVERGVLVITGHAKGGRNNPREYQFTFQYASVNGDTDDTLSNIERMTPMTPFDDEKGDTHDTVLERVTPLKGDIQRTERVTSETERVTPMTLKGDTAMSPEPSRTVKEPSGEPLAEREQPPPRPKAKAKPRRQPSDVPDTFEISDRLRAWAPKQGFTEAQMESQIDFFLASHRKKGNRYVDWDAAFQEWMHRARQYGQLDERKPATVTPFQRTNTRSGRGMSQDELFRQGIEGMRKEAGQ